MKLVTPFVLKDEPCWGLYEGPALVPQVDGSTQERWIQDVQVIRNDTRHHYVTDYGPAEDFDTITPMMMPSFGENTVAQLQAFADKNREDDYWSRRTQEMIEGSTLIADHVRQFEQEREIRRNRSVFGPAVNSQRNGYPAELVMRNWFDERARRTGKQEFFT